MYCMIAYQVTISGANLILPRATHGGSSRQGRARTWTGYAACRHVRVRRQIEHDPIQKYPGIEKPAAVSGAGLVLAMLNICR
jgi:hypothetical protein